MCIDISEELVDAAEKNDPKAISMLEKLALAIKYKKHLIFAEISLLDRILNLGYLDPMSKSQYLKIKKRYSEIGHVRSFLTFKAVVLISGNNYRHDKGIVINAANSERFEVYEECHLLTENLIDGEFFEYLKDRYIKSKGTSWPICYMPQMGGGSTMAKVYEMEIDRGQHFCISIIDSDKKWPSAKKGDTWRLVRDVDKDCYYGDENGSDGCYAFNCTYYAMEELRELENLIPLEVLQSMPDVKSNQLLSMGLDLSYHDMKNGLLIRTIIEGDYQNYLHSVYGKYPDIVADIDFYAAYRKAFHANDKDGYEKACGKVKLSNGLGSKIMEHTLKEASNELDKFDFSKLTAEQQHEWNNIGRKIFEWCCSFDGGITT